MDRLCVSPVLPESSEEFDHSVDAATVAMPSYPQDIKVDPPQSIHEIPGTEAGDYSTRKILPAVASEQEAQK